MQKGGLIASFIHNSNFARGRLEKVDVYLKNLDSSYILKMKLFTYDILRNCPGIEIKNSDIYVDFTGEARWYSIKINDTIYIPKNGICVGFEAIPKNSILLDEKNQCGKSSVVFSSYYEKLENGNRTSFTSLQNNNWYTPQAKDLKVDNVLNLAVRININGHLNIPNQTKPKFISNRKVVRKLKAKSSLTILNHSTIEDLFKSIVKCVEKNDLIGISQLIVINKENKAQFKEFADNNIENWLTIDEKNKALLEWNYYIDNLKNAEIIFLSEGYIEIIFPNKSNLFLFKEISGWKISPYYKKIVN